MNLQFFLDKLKSLARWTVGQKAFIGNFNQSVKKLVDTCVPYTCEA